MTAQLLYNGVEGVCRSTTGLAFKLH